MAFPKKGTRSVTHKGQVFHWRYGKSNKAGLASILIEKANLNGEVLSVQFQTDIDDLYLDFSEPVEMAKNKNYRPAKPSMVLNYIEQALDLGWKCDVSGKTQEYITDKYDALTLVTAKE
jgi:hypothetical protein